MDRASSIEEWIEALQVLHEHDVRIVLFMSPIFLEIIEWQEIILQTKDFADEYWLENLNLRGNYKLDILQYVKEQYPSLYPLYEQIYIKKDGTYWQELEKKIIEFCQEQGVKAKNYFYHEKIRKP